MPLLNVARVKDDDVVGDRALRAAGGEADPVFCVVEGLRRGGGGCLVGGGGGRVVRHDE